MEEVEKIKSRVAELDELLQPLNYERNVLTRRLKEILDDKINLYTETLPKNIEEFNSQQFDWLLYHWYDQSSIEYKARQDILHYIPVYTTGIFGGEVVKQFQFLATSYSFPGFVKLYNLAKANFKTVKSDYDETQIIVLEVTMSNYDILEINKDTDMGRFGWLNQKTHVTEWLSFDEIQKDLDEDYDDDENDDWSSSGRCLAE